LAHANSIFISFQNPSLSIVNHESLYYFAVYIVDFGELGTFAHPVDDPFNPNRYAAR
jgi:hypothetical protein